MSDERQEVILLTSDIASHEIGTNVASSCSSAANTTSALTKLITASSSGTNSGNTFILYIPSFRKIEPKPELELKVSGEDEEKELLDKDAKSSAGRFLAINATKRGVKTCQVCFKKIGYRAKQCKYCSPSKHKRRPRIQAIKPSIKPISRKTAQLIAQHIHVDCDNPEPVRNDHDSNADQQECPDRLEESLLPRNVDTQQLDRHVEAQTQEAQMEAIVSPLEDSNQFDTTLIECSSQSVDAQKTQEAHLLTEATHVSAQEDQQQLDAAVDNLLNQPEKIVLDAGLVSNVTEVTTTGEIATTSHCAESQEPSTSDNQGVTNTVFISSKVTQSIESQGLRSDSGRFSLQELICGLLAQNQGVSVSHTDPKELNTSVAALNTESVDSQTCKAVDTRSRLNSELSPKEKTGDSSFDANSVALFLGEMAQRNSGKKRKITPFKSQDVESKVVALIPGTNQKCILMTSGEHKAGKFRKIQPKDTCVGQDEISICDEDKDIGRDTSGDIKEQQCRIMNGNATRRGVMLCSKCNKMIGCRSKICKHCKHSVTESTTRQASNKLIKQAVKLSLPAELGVEIYSVRKCKTGPELRCFVQFDPKNSSGKSTKYVCDYPLCVTAKELEDKTSNYMCEHAKNCFLPVLQAKVPTLDFDKLAMLNLTDDMKESVQRLYSESQSKGIPLVQYVSPRTLAIFEHVNATSCESPGTTSSVAGVVSFAHVRFENIKGQGCFQQQVHCSGRSCMTWNFISSDPNTKANKSYSCVHYVIALWAVVSDPSLQKDLGEFLDAFVSQAKQGDSL